MTTENWQDYPEVRYAFYRASVLVLFNTALRTTYLIYSSDDDIRRVLSSVHEQALIWGRGTGLETKEVLCDIDEIWSETMHMLERDGTAVHAAFGAKVAAIRREERARLN
jgi:hypothetical protein